MAGFDGSGTFNRQYSWVDDFNAGLFIDATRMDTEFDLVAAALSNCITRDGQSPATQNIPMGNNKITGLAAAASNGDAVRYEQVFTGASKTAEVTVASASTCNILGAASDIIAISGTATITSFGTGTNKIRFVRFTGAATLTHNATTLILPGGTDIVAEAGDTCIVISDGSSNARVIAYQYVDGAVITGPVAIDGTVTITDPLDIAYGGTGVATAQLAADVIFGGAATSTGTPTYVMVLESGVAKAITLANFIQKALNTIGSTKGNLLYCSATSVWSALAPA